MDIMTIILFGLLFIFLIIDKIYTVRKSNIRHDVLVDTVNGFNQYLHNQADINKMVYSQIFKRLDYCEAHIRELRSMCVEGCS